jgi:hypothetical protein
MFCPICNQEQTSDETRFCSRCGFLLTGISQVIANGGILPHVPASDGDRNAISPRRKGIKQGTLLFFLGLIMVPIASIITIAVGEDPFVAAAIFFLTVVGGILRMLYAFLFESNQPGVSEESVLPEVLKKALPKKNQPHALSPQQSVPASSYVPPPMANWRDTNDLAAPPSVTDSTTRLLEKDA